MGNHNACEFSINCLQLSYVLENMCRQCLRSLFENVLVKRTNVDKMQTKQHTFFDCTVLARVVWGREATAVKEQL